MIFDWWLPFIGPPNAVQFIMAGPNLSKPWFTYNANWTTLQLRTWIYFIESCRPLPTPTTWTYMNQIRKTMTDLIGLAELSTNSGMSWWIWWHQLTQDDTGHKECKEFKEFKESRWRGWRLQLCFQLCSWISGSFPLFHDDASIRLQDESSHEAKPN